MNVKYIAAGLLLLAGTAISVAQTDITSAFIVAKGLVYHQTSNGAPALAATGAALLEITAPGAGGPSLVSAASVTLPNGATKTLNFNADNSLVVYTASADTASALDSLYGSGNYTLNESVAFFGTLAGTEGLPTATFPDAPVIANYAAAQAVDAAADFTLQLGPIAGVQSTDNITVDLLDGMTSLVHDTVTPGDQTYQISAGVLEAGKTYSAVVRYEPVILDTLGFPSVGHAFFAETHFGISTKGNSVDPTPPTLVGWTPTNGVSEQPRLTPLTLNFSKAMATNISIQWTASIGGVPFTLDPASFYPYWEDGGKSLIISYGPVTGGWPAGADIGWTLNPSAGPQDFADTAGRPLAIGAYSGSFLVAGGPWHCAAQRTNVVEAPGFHITKAVHYAQTSAAPATADTQLGATLTSYLLDSDNPLLMGSSYAPLCLLYVPTANPHQFFVKPMIINFTPGLSSDFRLFTDTQPDKGTLDAAYPAGSYSITLAKPDPNVRTNPPVVVAKGSLNVAAGAYPPTPHFANYAAAQTLNPSNAFTVTWDAYAGADPQASFVRFQILSQETNVVFSAPDSCAGLPMGPTSTSVTIPENTLTNGATYTFELTFAKRSDLAESIPGILAPGYAALESVTRMTLAAGGKAIVPSPATLTVLSATLAGALLQVDCTAGAPIELQASPLPGGPFTTLFSTNPASARFQWSGAGFGGATFYRALNP
jgi:hypothetical protein